MNEIKRLRKDLAELIFSKNNNLTDNAVIAKALEIEQLIETAEINDRI